FGIGNFVRQIFRIVGERPMSRTGKALLRLGFQVGGAIGYLSPVIGLGIFWWLPFKPAVTLYVLINGLAYALLKFIELRRLSMDLDEIVTRQISQRSK
ncbi:MAG: hypothetical protein ACREQA_14685, partial [Candidatus Binatia bacterium]